MAETIVVQRGNIATHNMHLYPDETPTGMWASIEAQNAGLVAGNWQNHLICTRDSWQLDTFGQYPHVEQVNQWRMRWPRLGSYSRLSFSAWASPTYRDYILRLWPSNYSAPLYVATITVLPLLHAWGRVTFEWSMDKAGLSSHLNTAVWVELLSTREEEWPYDTWNLYTKRFCLVTANCPL